MASQAGPTPLPATTILKSERISQAEAHEFLTAYLDRAASDPGFQPDSTLSPQGPIAAGVGSSPNLVIHNLKRVQAGLAGEVLGKDLIYAKLENEGGAAGGIFELHSHNATDGQNWGGKKRETPAVSGWQDLQSYEREQTDIVEAGDGDEEVVAVEDNIEAVEDIQEGKIDKEERKRQKKERRKQEQKAKMAAARKENEDDETEI
ncbi:hypothetical protein TMEN_6099 [Trichophyton mentagrophytes]|uniref:Uncharacterized protein n=1 Tax=Trichophyton interdigitale (strain MR816) TaxID=1215338 RepID=A0A059J7I0_TRIIM|nr:hypothetical protein H101_07271 [Trichophyton interdigitale H6]KDB23739.1 hypothetical protein H109_04419 [Trichophyton interdigitale MR816]GBF63474.1 hypothetical protein TMEN_6099 [Trichophyton mentagrophytes]